MKLLKIAYVERVMTYYDQIAKGYNELHGEEQKSKARIIIANLDIRPEDELLDVGCGTGIATELFPCRKTGIDPSAELVKQCSFPAAAGRAETLLFEDGCFDIVVSITAIQNFEDAEKGVKEMKRVAKKDIVISTLKKSGRLNEIKKAIEKHLKVVKKLKEENDIIFFCR